MVSKFFAVHHWKAGAWTGSRMHLNVPVQLLLGPTLFFSVSSKCLNLRNTHVPKKELHWKVQAHIRRTILAALAWV